MTPEELINPVIDRIKQTETDPKSNFDMAKWRTYGSHPCGTSACIAGWFEIVHHPEIDYYESQPAHNAGKLLAEVFGLEKLAAEMFATELFTPHREMYRLSDITIDHAVKVLEHLRDTGEVDWSIGEQSSIDAHAQWKEQFRTGLMS